MLILVTSTSVILKIGGVPPFNHLNKVLLNVRFALLT